MANREMTELEKAVEWLSEAKSPIVQNKKAPFRAHAASNITSIKRVAAMLQISFTEALILTYTGMKNVNKQK